MIICLAYKKGDIKDCNNYQTNVIVILSVSHKMYSNFIKDT